MNTHKIGQLHEDLACVFLEKHSVKIIKRNLRSPKGEVDIIGVDGFDLVFIEVKSLSDGNPWDLARLINKKKQKKIIDTAIWYGKKHKLKNQSIRFDVVFFGKDEPLWIKDAFWNRGNCDLK